MRGDRCRSIAAQEISCSIGLAVHCLLDDRREDIGTIHGEVGKDLTVERDVLLFERMHQA